LKRLILILILLLSARAVAAQETITPALEQHLEAIEQLTAKLRGLDAITPVEHRFPSREDVQQYLEREMNIQLDDETLKRETQFYIAFDLLPPDVNLRDVYLNFLTSPAGVAGFYDTDTKAMNVLLIGGGELKDMLPLLDQITYAHEYTHALQDQHFGLDKLLNEETSVNPDLALAHLSLAEGAATASMTPASPSAPVFTAPGGMSASTASNCCATSSGASTSTRVTACVFCTVTSDTTAMPYTPCW
jgi:hypothetical protein